MKRSLMRPTAALFPLAGAIVSALGDAAIVMTFFFHYFLMQIVSLCAVDCFRNAAAREPGLRRVDRRFGASLIPLLAALGVSLALSIPSLRDTEPGMLNLVAMSVAAWCMIIEQLFEERMYAVGKGMDVVLMDVISSALLMTGMLLDGLWQEILPIPGMCTLCGSALSMLIAATASLVTEPLRGFSIAPRNLGFCLKAGMQSLFFPAAMCALHILQIRRGEYSIDALESYLFLPLLVGMIPWRLSRTVCRRSADESRPLNLLLTAIAAAGVILAAVMDEMSILGNDWEILRICTEALVLAMVCSVIVFCAPGWRIYAGAALVILAGVKLGGYVPCGVFIRSGLCLIAVILNMHKAFLRKV